MSISAAKTNHLGKSRSHYWLCFRPCKRCITAGDTHSLCVVCLGAKHAEAALEGAGCPHYEHLPRCALRSRRALFTQGALASVPRDACPVAAELE